MYFSCGTRSLYCGVENVSKCWWCAEQSGRTRSCRSSVPCSPRWRSRKTTVLPTPETPYTRNSLHQKLSAPETRCTRNLLQATVSNSLHQNSPRFPTPETSCTRRFTCRSSAQCSRPLQSPKTTVVPTPATPCKRIVKEKDRNLSTPKTFGLRVYCLGYVLGARGRRQLRFLQGNLAHKNPPPPPRTDHRRALDVILLQGPTGSKFLRSEVPLYTLNPKHSTRNPEP